MYVSREASYHKWPKGKLFHLVKVDKHEFQEKYKERGVWGKVGDPGGTWEEEESGEKDRKQKAMKINVCGYWFSLSSLYEILSIAGYLLFPHLYGPPDKGENRTPPSPLRLSHFHAGEYTGWTRNQTQSQNPWDYFCSRSVTC